METKNICKQMFRLTYFAPIIRYTSEWVNLKVLIYALLSLDCPEQLFAWNTGSHILI